MTIEIVDFPIDSMVDLSIVMLVYEKYLQWLTRRWWRFQKHSTGILWRFQPFGTMSLDIYSSSHKNPQQKYLYLHLKYLPPSHPFPISTTFHPKMAFSPPPSSPSSPSRWGSLIEQGDEIVANGRLLDLIRRVRTFGISPSVGKRRGNYGNGGNGGGSEVVRRGWGWVLYGMIWAPQTSQEIRWLYFCTPFQNEIPKHGPAKNPQTSSENHLPKPPKNDFSRTLPSSKPSWNCQHLLTTEAWHAWMCVRNPIVTRRSGPLFCPFLGKKPIDLLKKTRLDWTRLLDDAVSKTTRRMAETRMNSGFLRSQWNLDTSLAGKLTGHGHLDQLLGSRKVHRPWAARFLGFFSRWRWWKVKKGTWLALTSW